MGKETSIDLTSIVVRITKMRIRVSPKESIIL
jgi:hypothetical protein